MDLLEEKYSYNEPWGISYSTFSFYRQRYKVYDTQDNIYTFVVAEPRLESMVPDL